MGSRWNKVVRFTGCKIRFTPTDLDFQNSSYYVKICCVNPSQFVFKISRGVEACGRNCKVFRHMYMERRITFWAGNVIKESEQNYST